MKMNPNKDSLILLLAFIIAFLSIVLIALNSIIKEKNARIEQTQNHADFTQLNLSLNFKYSNTSFKCLIQNQQDTLQFLTGRDSKRVDFLGIYYPNEVCTSCFDDSFRDLMNVIDTLAISNERFFLITRFENNRLVKVFRDRINPKCGILNLKLSLTNNSFFSIKQPSLLFFDKDCNIKNVLLVDYSRIAMTTDFIKLFKNE